MCDGRSDGRHASVESCMHMIGPLEQGRVHLPEGASEHAYSSIVISFPEIALWNTVYMAEAVAQLKREGYPVNESDLPHIWPTRYEHINVYGRYHFNIEEAQRREGLRPLRQLGVNIP